ncbi:hypothetical protein CHUAL_013564 [Chamberlinius hualienensis]
MMSESASSSSSCVGTKPPIRPLPELEVPEVGRLLDDDGSVISCGLPGTPEEDHMLHDHDEVIHTVREVVPGAGLRQRPQSMEDDDVDIDMSITKRAAEQAEMLVRKVWEASWKVTHFHSLPKWLQDNDFLMFGHRPPLYSFYACLKSIFRIHTETGNIWTHLLGCVAFIGMAFYFLTRPEVEIQWQEKTVFAFFFAGAIICLGLSSMFHTFSCHSERVGKLFSKLDYCGIALLIIGSFIPWLYYGFYCEFQPKLIYLIVVVVLGITAVIVSLWDRFGEPKFRWLRAGLFMGFGLSGVIPAIHYLAAEGFFNSSFGWLLLMAGLYILGALLYAMRVPERFFPGKCDIWFHSHQLFHVLVIAAAFVHYHGISELAMNRLTVGNCEQDRVPSPDVL